MEQKTKTMEQKTKTTINLILIGAVLFLLGMKIESVILSSQFNEAFADYEKLKLLDFENKIQKFEFNLSAYSAQKTQEPLKDAFACVLGDGNVMVDMYANIFIPALYGEPVCFVNNLTFNNLQDNIDNLSVRDFAILSLKEK